MKKVLKGAMVVIGGVVTVFVLVMGLQMIASETGEVVVLHSQNSAGEIEETRLWVVDYEGGQYLRVGADGSGWFSRLSANPAISLERAGTLAEYRAAPHPELSAPVNALMQEKYGWRDSYISMLFGYRISNFL